MPSNLSEPNHRLGNKPCDEFWVVKLGGSLFNQPNLADRLRTVIRRLTQNPLLVVGGGAAADAVRQWDQIHHLSPSTAHWLAIQGMELNRSLIETLLPQAAGVGRLDEAVPVWERRGIAILNTWDWLQAEEKQGNSLPHSWDVTSDAIAAWAAIRWRAAGLLLLKSVDLPNPAQVFAENEAGFVDRYFSHLAPRLPKIAWCNLASPACEIVDCS